MSFGAMAAWQAWLLIFAAGGFAAWLFFRKVRPPRVNVPSLILWRRVLDQARALTWWERVRRAVSLVATIALAVALALALVRPGPSVTAARHGRLLIVLDSSWSMLAKTSIGRTRWDRARSEARALAASASGDMVALATTAEGLIEGPTSDLALVDSAIERATPLGGEGADWPRVADAGAVHFITDGAIGRPLDQSVIVHSVYEQAPNVAITAFDVRPSSGADAAAEGYLEIANYAPTPQRVRMTLTRGTTSLADQSIDMAAGEAVRQTIAIKAGGAATDSRLRARISAPANALAIDDEAVASIAGTEPLTVTIVSDDPVPLGLLLARFPSIQVTYVTPAAYRPATTDLVVFDRWLPAAAPSQPALCIAPPAGSWLGRLTDAEKQPHWTALSAHPVAAGVDPLTLDIKRAHGFEGDFLEPIGRSDQGTTLLAIVDRPDRRLVVLTFGFADSNLALAPAFPVLMGNAIEWLARPDDGSAKRPGWVSLPASTTRLTAPDGRPVTLTPLGASVAARVTTPGFYVADAGGSRRLIAVNVGDPQISNLEHTALAAGSQPVVTGGGFGRPWWLYALGFAFALAAAEWWTWQRRITV
jgi:hypothetical protein